MKVVPLTLLYPCDEDGNFIAPQEILSFYQIPGSVSIQVVFKKNPRQTYTYKTSRLKKLLLQKTDVFHPVCTIKTSSGIPLEEISRISIYKERIQDFSLAVLTQGKKEIFWDMRQLLIFSHPMQTVLSYLEQVAERDTVLQKAESPHEEDEEDGNMLLDMTRHYARMLPYITSDSALSLLIEHNNVRKNPILGAALYPFSTNQSQMTALHKALSSRISIIKGPPGTGKTQVILNIVANLVMNGKSIAIVSNNNSATDNVYQKFAAAGLNFFMAQLGNKKNKEIFIAEQERDTFQDCAFPDMTGWERTSIEKHRMMQRIEEISVLMEHLFRLQNRRAYVKSEIAALLYEEQKFEASAQKFQLHYLKFKKKQEWSSQDVLKFLTACEYYSLHESWFFRHITFFFKYPRDMRVRIREAVYDSKVLNTYLRFYYQQKKKELEREVTEIEQELASRDIDALTQEMTTLSRQVFTSYLAYRYKDVLHVPRANPKTAAPEQFLKDYPVVLSTLHSLATSLSEPTIYDYLIIDEASQASILVAVQALTYGRNIILVGDLNQLPAILKRENKRAYQEIETQFSSLPGYWKMSNAEASILRAVETIQSTFPKLGIPEPTLLKEHYRCAPLIARFFNERFYNNELILMTEEDGTFPHPVLKLCPPCDSDSLLSSSEQVEQARQLVDAWGTGAEVAIITPYKAQLRLLDHYFPQDTHVEKGTVHTFQGREKDYVIFSTAAREVSRGGRSFLKNESLINVAVSRARKSLTVLTSPQVFASRSVTGDLCRYIESHGGGFRVEEMPYVFRLLFKDYADVRNNYLTVHPQVHEYLSEELMEKIIKDVLTESGFETLTYLMHYPLLSIQFPAVLYEDERQERFLQHPWSHVDFLIFDTMNSCPVLAVEVQGYGPHSSLKQKERDAIKKKAFSAAGILFYEAFTQQRQEDGTMIREIRHKEHVRAHLQRALGISVSRTD